MTKYVITQPGSAETPTQYYWDGIGFRQSPNDALQFKSRMEAEDYVRRTKTIWGYLMIVPVTVSSEAGK